MTDEEINQAIAAHVGAKMTKFYDWSGPGTDSWVQWPNYCADLNEMHRVEERAGPKIIKAMRFHLHEICDEMTAHHATARQRAEAFLRTVGKWKE